MAKWRRHSLEFKRQTVEKMKTCNNIHELARELDVQRKLLYTWRCQLEGRPEARDRDLSQSGEATVETKLRAENQRLKSVLADRTLELDFFQSALRRVEKASQSSRESGEPVSMPKSGHRHSGKAD